MTSEAQAPVWPVAKFSFSVAVDGELMSFQEASGLDVGAGNTEDRADDSPLSSQIKTSGVRRIPNVLLSKGLIAKDSALLACFSQMDLNALKPKTAVISLLDETGAAIVVWTLARAWPVKMVGTELIVEGTLMAVETLELCHSGITVSRC